MRKVAYYFVGFFWVKLLILEWVIDMVLKVVSVIHESIKVLAGALENIIQELKQKTSEPDSREVK